MSSEFVIEARGLEKSYLMGQESVKVLHGLDMEVRDGEIVSVIGTSGSGKSTMLHLMGLLDRPDSGWIRVDGEDVTGSSAAKRARVRRGAIGFVFQFYHLLPELNALENVLVSGMIGGGLFSWRRGMEKGGKTNWRDRARELLSKVGLEHRLKHRPSQLSGGERQRVAIARALLSRPRVVLCDEPTGNLDEKTSREIEELLFQLKEDQNQTLVLVTHNQHLARRTDRTLILERGVLHPRNWDAEEYSPEPVVEG